MIFDPIQLTESITPASVEAELSVGDYGKALRMSVHLNEVSLIKSVIEHVPFDAITHVVKSIAPEQLEKLMQVLSAELSDSPHVEFYLHWCLKLLQCHGLYIERNRSSLMRAFRVMYMAVFSNYQSVKNVSDENKFLLEFLEEQTDLQLRSEV